MSSKGILRRATDNLWVSAQTSYPALQEASTGRRTSAAWVDPALADAAYDSTAQANGHARSALPQSTAATVTPTFSANPRGVGGGFGVTTGDPSGLKGSGGAFTKLLSRIGLATPEDFADGQVTQPGLELSIRCFCQISVTIC